MQNAMLKRFLRAQDRALKGEDGQDLVEYALVVALVALAATAGMGSLATGINTAFGQIGTTLTSYTG